MLLVRAMPPKATSMKRRDFISALGAVAVSASAPAWAQQSTQPRRIGVLMNLAAEDPEGKMRSGALLQALEELGWSKGHNLRIDYRWGAGDAELFRRYSEELLALRPDAILATGTPVVEALQRVTRAVPIVFVTVIDPVGAGFVESLAHPGGNTTGFSLFDFSMSGKWVELLKEIVPQVRRVAVLRDPAIASGTGQLAAIQAVAPAFALELSPIGVRNADDIERSLAEFASQSNGSIIVTASTLALVHRRLIIELAERYRLPAIYGDRTFAIAGGLISYGPNRVEPFRRAAGYLHRILKGEKPSDLPVQAPTTYELVVNFKTAKTLDLTVPYAVLARATEVIE
jgi:putative tryptophan/tyrosine transport system substrate-binding protein